MPKSVSGPAICCGPGSRLKKFATLFAAFEESLCETSSFRQVAPPEDPLRTFLPSSLSIFKAACSALPAERFTAIIAVYSHNSYLYIYIYTYSHIYIYIYIYAAQQAGGPDSKSMGHSQ